MVEIVLVAAMAQGRVIGMAGGNAVAFAGRSQAFQGSDAGSSGRDGAAHVRVDRSSVAGATEYRGVTIPPEPARLPVVLADSLDSALAACGDVEAIMLIGGGEIYRQALDRATRLELSLIDAANRGRYILPGV